MLRAENKANAQQNNQPQQPAADPNALARIEARLDAIQAEQRAKAAMQQPQQQPMMQMPMMQMPMQQPMMQMPMQMPMYGPQPYGMGGNGGNGGNSNDPVMVAELTRLKAENEAHMRVELERARTETERAKADAEIAKARAESGRMQQAQPQYTQPAPQPMYVQYAQPQPQPMPQAQPVAQQGQAPVVIQLPAQSETKHGADSNFSAETVGAIMASMMKNMGGEKPKEPKTVIEAESQPTVSNIPTVYPPDAVITTTTMVDTTKKPQTQRISREDNQNFDIDGFYDAFEDNK